MSLAEIVFAILGAVGTVVGVAVSVRGRQLSKPRLHVNLGDRSSAELKALHTTVQTIVFGLPRSALSSDMFVPCVHVFSNPTKVPVTDIRAEIIFPRLCACGGAAARETIVGRSELEYFGDFAREITEIRMLRPGESVTHCLWLRIPKQPGPLTRDAETARLFTRSSSVAGFRNAVVVRIAAWCSNAPNVAIETPILVFEADAVHQLGDRYEAAAWAAWEGKRPAPGRYWTYPWERKRVNFGPVGAELMFFDTPNVVRERPEASISVTTDGALVLQELPPWGLLGTAYDLFAP